MRLASISSGSKGNCILIENAESTVMLDAGISKKRIEEGLNFFHKKPEDIDGIVITHEHSDHIKGLGVFLRKYNKPVYATEKTIEYILNSSSIGNVDSDLFHVVVPMKEFLIGDTQILPMRISHDAVDPVCYKFISNLSTEDKSCAVVTDLGESNDILVNHIKDIDALLLESNHDIGMLQTGPYPYYLKQRIWGNKGHLSNEACGDLINQIISEKLKHIILGHLSHENNYPELAFQAVRNEINFGMHDFCADDLDLKVASRNEPSSEIDF